jgi:hypothetical protein
MKPGAHEALCQTGHATNFAIKHVIKSIAAVKAGFYPLTNTLDVPIALTFAQQLLCTIIQAHPARHF